MGLALLAFRFEYSRVLLFGSGFLVFIWVVGEAHLRRRHALLESAIGEVPDLLAHLDELGGALPVHPGLPQSCNRLAHEVPRRIALVARVRGRHHDDFHL